MQLCLFSPRKVSTLPSVVWLPPLFVFCLQFSVLTLILVCVIATFINQVNVFNSI